MEPSGSSSRPGSRPPRTRPNRRRRRPVTSPTTPPGATSPFSTRTAPPPPKTCWSSATSTPTLTSCPGPAVSPSRPPPDLAHHPTSYGKKFSHVLRHRVRPRQAALRRLGTRHRYVPDGHHRVG